jgi:hypothetical protein
MVVVDEFQTFTGVRWQEVLGETRKYGGRFVIGMQNFASLGCEDMSAQDQRGRILGGVGSLFAFQMNGEDAHYLSKHKLAMGRGGPGLDTLTSLEPYRSYARLVREDGRLTRPFYFESAPPPAYDESLAEELLARRAKYSLRYEEALSAAHTAMAALEGYGRTLLSQGDSGTGRRVGSCVSGSMRMACGPSTCCL